MKHYIIPFIISTVFDVIIYIGLYSIINDYIIALYSLVFVYISIIVLSFIYKKIIDYVMNSRFSAMNKD